MARPPRRLAGAACLAVALAACAPACCDARAFDCEDRASCQAAVDDMIGRLAVTKEAMRRKQQTAATLEDLRNGVLTGRRIELSSAQRQHLERGNPVLGQVTFDARHRPVSTNVTRHFRPLLRIATSTEVRVHALMPLKRPSASAGKAGPTALLVTLDNTSRLSIWDLDGEALLTDLDLGHGAERTVTHMALSPSQDNHFILTADDAGAIRMHSLKVVGAGMKEPRPPPREKGPPAREPAKTRLSVSANLTGAFSLPAGLGSETRRLTAVAPVERGSQTWIVVGDNLGGISVFLWNGTMKGRVRVTTDPGGVLALTRHQGQLVFFTTAYSFGFFSPTLLDVQSPPCSGWNAPLFDAVVDPVSSSNRVVLALSDGDVLVFTTQQGKTKVCELTMKFPHVSMLPFKLQAFKGHIMALPTPLPERHAKEDYHRELFFFNLAAMDAGYGVTPSRAVSLQASFLPREVESFSVLSAGSPQDRSRAQIAIRFDGERGVELFDLTLKQPASPKSAPGGEGGAQEGGLAGWLNYFPKIGMFGATLVAVLIWNVRKMSGQRKSGPPGAGGGGALGALGGFGGTDLDEEFFKARRGLRGDDGGADVGMRGGGGGPPHPQVEDLGERDE